MKKGVKQQRKPRMRTAKCPICGERFSPQGVAGHLRFVHALEGKNMNKERQAALAGGVGGVLERARKTRELLAELKAIREERDELRKRRPENDRLAGASAAVKREQQVCDDALAMLEGEALDLHNEIRALHGQKPLVRRDRSWVWDDALEEQAEPTQAEAE